MPILNGLEASEKIRDATRHSKIIFVTLNGDEEVKAAALAAGAEDYLRKHNAATLLLPAIEIARRNHVATAPTTNAKVRIPERPTMSTSIRIVEQSEEGDTSGERKPEGALVFSVNEKSPASLDTGTALGFRREMQPDIRS